MHFAAVKMTIVRYCLDARGLIKYKDVILPV